MKISNVMYTAAALAVASLMAGCSGGGGGAAVSTNAVGGAAVKGPFKTGATVTACPVNPATALCSGAATATTTVVDNLGNYSLKNITWGGMTLITVNGNYLDEITNTTQVGALSAIVNLPAPTATGNTVTSVNPNIATSIAAAVAANEATKGVALDATTLQAANSLANAALGLPAGTDPTTLNPLNNAQFLTVSAAFADLSATSGASIQNLATSMANDIATGQPLGTTVPTGAAAPVTAALTTSLNTATVSAATIQANLQAAVPAGTAVTVVTPVAPATPPATVLKGLGLTGNAFTVGIANCTIAATGAATCAGTPVSTAVTFNLPLLDLTNATGTAPGAAGTTQVAVSFSIADNAIPAGAVAKRQMTGTISPVNVATNGAGGVTFTVPVNATMTVSGTTSTGAIISNVVLTNLTANMITTGVGNVMTVNANQMLAMVQAKAATNPQLGALNVLGLPGTYNFSFGVSGNIGFVNATNNGIVNLIPVGTGGGRVISGQITTI